MASSLVLIAENAVQRFGRRSEPTPSLADPDRDHRRATARDHVAEAELRLDVAQTLNKLGPDDQTVARGLMTHTVSQLARRELRHRQRLYETLPRIREALEAVDLRDCRS